MIGRQLRNELWKLFGKKRTYIGFGMLLLAQLAVTLVFRYSNASRGAVRALEGNGYLAAPYISGLTIAAIMLFPIAYILMPLYLALVGGDLVAKEAEDGTLRMILSRPISRGRLLAVKWLAGHLGLQREQVMAIGDMLNDLPMIQWAGTGVAMPRAAALVREAADFVPEHEEEGVAETLEKYFG